jgi:superfamily I DNA/RNA helicase/mRNA-degrading endonuclease RelE of RelBE toxin-antitoxin system
MRIEKHQGKVAIHQNFLHSLSLLSKKEQKQIRKTVQNIVQSPDSPGLRTHKVENFLSLSVSMDIRIIANKTKEQIIILYVAHHDQAYRWAKHNHAILSDDGNMLGIVKHTTTDDALLVQNQTPLPEDKREGFIFRNIGLPKSLATLLASTNNEDELLELISSLAPEYQEVVLNIAAQKAIDKSETWEAPSDVKVFDSDEDLKYALKLPEYSWRVFLHPRQRFAIEIPEDHNVLLRGGPGTGKTIALLHRYSRLSRISYQKKTKSPVLVALTLVTKRVLLEGLRQIAPDINEYSIVISEELPKTDEQLKEFLNMYSSIIVDEGQDLPGHYLAKILRVAENASEKLTPHYIAHDSNQAIVSPSGYGLEQLSEFFDLINLTYSYRATNQNVATSAKVLKYLHRFKGKDFQHSHHIMAMRDSISSKYYSGLSGPDVESQHVNNEEECNDALINILHRFSMNYKSGLTIAIIILSNNSSRYWTLKTELECLLGDQPYSVEILTSSGAKGREFFAGIIIDENSYPSNYELQNSGVTMGFYSNLCGLYVGVSRFRDRIAYIYHSQNSPLKEISKIENHKRKKRI